MSFISDATSSSAAPFRPSAEEQVSSAQITFTKSVAGASPVPKVSVAGVQSSTFTYTVTKDNLVVRWSPYLESQFQELVALRAAKKASPQDMERLGRIRSLRQRFKNPIDAAQLLRDFKARELRKQALEAVSAYALFVKNP